MFVADPPIETPLHTTNNDGVCRAALDLFIYLARESSLVPAGFLTAQFLQKLYIYEAFVVMEDPEQYGTYLH